MIFARKNGHTCIQLQQLVNLGHIEFGLGAKLSKYCLFTRFWGRFPRSSGVISIPWRGGHGSGMNLQRWQRFTTCTRKDFVKVYRNAESNQMLSPDSRT